MRAHLLQPAEDKSQYGLRRPDIVEAILNGQQGATPQLHEFMKPFPLEWERQKKKLMTGAY
jgi:hypothetical protein